MSEKKFFVAGVQHHQLKQIINDLEEGYELDLVPEPDNKFDPNAIAIKYDEVMLGYVPKKFSAEVSAMIESGKEMVCSVTILNRTAKPWEQLEVSIYEDVPEEDELDKLAEEEEEEEDWDILDESRDDEDE